MAQFEIYKDVDMKYRWRFQSTGNNKTIAMSSESYDSQQACEASVNLVKKDASSATIKYLF